MKTLIALCIVAAISGCNNNKSHILGINIHGSLQACPNTPNCIQSYQPADNNHFVSPMQVKLSLNETKAAIIHAIQMTGGVIKEHKLQTNSFYLHAEYHSAWLKFTDDIEVLIQSNQLHIRSASRLGYSDLGVNKARVISIKDIYQVYHQP